MPEWLLKDENYIPQTDKDTFVNKSILSLLGILSRIRTQSGYRTEKFHVSAVLKVAFTFILIALLSMSRSFTFTIIVNVYLLFALSLMSADEIIKILRASFIIALFTFVILMPAAFWGNYYSMTMITPKVFATVIAVNILSYSTPWNLITGALKTFFIPDIFILVLDITIKYIMLLGEFSINMLYSLKLRSVGKNKNKYTSLSGIAGTMFIKSKEMAEDMYVAMECRGFTGEYHIYKKFRFTFADFIYIIINAVIIFTFIYLT
ncbi:MAG: energy-coupling factor transporter transmembrane component T [Ruminiclostridium sp.]